MKLILIMFILLTGCTRNVDYIKEHAAARWAELGYEVIGYEGYHWSPLAGGSVWYSIRNKETPGILYTGYLECWGNEIHVYGPNPVNGVKIQ